MLNRTYHIVLMTFIGLMLFQPVNILAAEEKLTEGMVNPGYEEKPKWFKLSFLDIREDVVEAAEEGKRVLLYFYQDGCPYCAKLLRDNFSQRTIVEKTRKNFDVIAVNMWGDREVTDLNGNVTIEKEFAKQLRVMFTPTMIFLNEKGDVALRVNGYYFPGKFEAALDYVSGKMEKKTRFAQYFAKLNPIRASGKLHHDPSYLKPPYNLTSKARKGDKPLLVLFEQKTCKACDELHQDFFKRKEVSEELKKFDVVLLDMWSNEPIITPDGKKTTVAKWAKDIDIKYVPGMTFFESSGKEVFRTEAYLRAFHTKGSMTYVSSGAYKTQPSFQRYLAGVADALHDKGIEVDLWK
jgi:thioredoxin-related protein